MRYAAGVGSIKNILGWRELEVRQRAYLALNGCCLVFPNVPAIGTTLFGCISP